MRYCSFNVKNLILSKAILSINKWIIQAVKQKQSKHSHTYLKQNVKANIAGTFKLT